MLDLAIIGLSPQHPRSFSQLINEENPNGEGLNGVARISMLWGPRPRGSGGVRRRGRAGNGPR